jgi:16S rRNA (cytidine1402-2'-O)-methyltransferase
LEVKPQTLYVVGTPIGNLGDITYRAVEVLHKVDLIAAEDTRHTGLLLQHFQIDTPQISFHSHNTQSRLPELLTALKNRSVALVTDAGMPGISDPGLELVQGCIAQGWRVVPIPGVTALVTGLVASGLDTGRFVFEGFLPTEKQARQQIIEALLREPRTIVFYEAPHRICKTLADLIAILGTTRPIVVGRELTKQFEEFKRFTLAEALNYFGSHTPRGEFTLILAGATPEPMAWTEDKIIGELQEMIKNGIPRSEASRRIAEFTGMAKRQIYHWSLQLEKEND